VKHLTAMNDASSVTGRFAGLIEWLDQFARAAGWEHRLDALETEVYRTRRERRRRGTTDQRQENTA
jgi:hypothetical protein